MKNNSTSELSIQELLQLHIEACSNLNFDIFENHLYDTRVEVNFPNKKKYEKYLRSLLRELRENGFKRLQLQIEDQDYLDSNTQEYNYYHPLYTHPRLNMKVTIVERKLIFSVLPF
jgi:hypothetical protein